jgi:membrane-bound lytic murein transglycosylase
MSMLLEIEIWLASGAIAALVVAMLGWLLQRKGRTDYKLNRHEHQAGFDFAQQQSDLKREQASIEQERRRAEVESRRLAAQANTQFEIAAKLESRELQEMAQATASNINALRTTSTTDFEAQAQEAIRRQQEEVAALLRRQESEIARVRAEQEQQIALRKAEYERAKEAHFNVLKRFEPPPAVVSYALASPIQEMADVMQNSYAQVAWAFNALAQKIERGM